MFPNLLRGGRLVFRLHVDGLRWSRWSFYLLHVGYFVLEKRELNLKDVQVYGCYRWALFGRTKPS